MLLVANRERGERERERARTTEPFKRIGGMQAGYIIPTVGMSLQPVTVRQVQVVSLNPLSMSLYPASCVATS